MADLINYTKEDLVDHHGISAVIKDKNGKILMQDHVKFGFWTIPVGKVKNGQSIIEGLKQEVFEEIGLTVVDCKEIEQKVFEYVRADIPVKVFTHIFEIEKYSGEIQNKEPNNHREQKFLSVEEIMKLPYLSDTTILYLSTLGLNRGRKLL